MRSLMERSHIFITFLSGSIDVCIVNVVTTSKKGSVMRNG